MPTEEMCESGTAMITQARTMRLSEKLSEQEKDAKQKLADIQRASALLKKNPIIEELLTILGRLGRNLI